MILKVQKLYFKGLLSYLYKQEEDLKILMRENLEKQREIIDCLEHINSELKILDKLEHMEKKGENNE